MSTLRQCLIVKIDFGWPILGVLTLTTQSSNELLNFWQQNCVVQLLPFHFMSHLIFQLSDLLKITNTEKIFHNCFADCKLFTTDISFKREKTWTRNSEFILTGKNPYKRFQSKITTIIKKNKQTQYNDSKTT